MDLAVVGLLASLLSVLVLALAFLTLYRNDRRRVRRQSRQIDPLVPLTTARRRPVPFPMPSRWIAIRTTNTTMVRETLGVANRPLLPWADALAHGRVREMFVSLPVDGWTLVIGAGVPDPAQDVDAAYRFLTRVSLALGELHFYSADRVLNFHTWARLDDGRVTRAYGWAGETLWNEGRMTLEEKLLGLRCRDYAEEPEPMHYGDIPPELHNTERVILLARRWSIDPVVASEILIQQETVESGGDENREE
ncbi:MAG TPA: hypothetical protein VMB21_19000 [Candidatus Limnocylindria bacterium]|jgi:hypothetical protein|nr:hypothetical protein [Candidatus Limnocylindria bacterium]